MKKVKFNGEIQKLKFIKDDYTNKYFLHAINNAIVTDVINIGHEHYSENSIDTMLCDGEIFYCEDCGSYEYENDIYYIEDMQKYVCSNCIDDYYYCNDCGNYYSRDSVTYIEGCDYYICDNCFYDDYAYCECCGEAHSRDDMHYVDYDGYYCDDCYDETDGNGVYGYHDFNDWQLYNTENDTDNTFYIGYELEIDDGSNEHEAVRDVQNYVNAVCMRDGSLHNGFEIVSHPQTYNYIMTHKDNMKTLFDRLINYGYTSHNSGTCGLHFHVTAPKENRHEIVSRLWAILEFYKNEIVKLSRRTDTQLHWCKWLTDDKELKSIEYYHIKGMSKDYTRYLAINDTNTKTIEFRFFRGTLKYNTFMAAVQFINNLYTFASDLNIKLQDITWQALTQGEYINTYVTDKNIQTTDVIIDNYEAISKYDYNVQYFYKRIIKMLEKKEREYYKKMLDRLNDKSNIYEIASNIDELHSRTKTQKMYEANRLFALKEYKKALELIKDYVIDYSICYKNGSKDIALYYTACEKNIEDLEGVILCA